MRCRCGKDVTELKSFFDKRTGYRLTVCVDCEKREGLDNKELFTSELLKNMTAEQNKTPLPNADYS